MFAADSATRQINLRAGEELSERFFVQNGDPDEMAAFRVEARGLPDGWARAGARSLPPGGQGEVELVLCPPNDAAPRDYLFQIALLQVGTAEPQRTEDACLRLSAGAIRIAPTPLIQAPPVSPPQPAPVAAPVVAAPASISAPFSPPVSAPQPAFPPPIPTPPAAPQNLAPPRQAVAVPPPAPPTIVAPPVVIPASAPPTFTPPMPERPAPIPVPVPVAAPVIPPNASYGTPATPAPGSNGSNGAAPAAARSRSLIPEGETNVLELARNPEANHVFILQPGDVQLVVFAVKNDGDGRNYSLGIENLDDEFFQLDRQQTNFENSNSTLSFYLRVRRTARPGERAFTVSIGPRGSARRINYRLRVVAAPRVKLLALQPARVGRDSSEETWASEVRVKSGPVGQIVPFRLQIERAVETDTAFRLAVRRMTPSGQVAISPAEAARGALDEYQKTPWRYAFDRELDRFETRGNAPPAPQSVVLNVERQGIWWWGWREKHRLQVAAVPVTEAASVEEAGQTGENRVELWAERWRLFPLPGFLMAPICLMVLLALTSGARDLRMFNGLPGSGAGGDSGTYFLLEPLADIDVNPAWKRDSLKVPPRVLGARLDWQAPLWGLLRMQAKENNQQVSDNRLVYTGWSDSLTIPQGNYSTRRTYELGPLLRVPLVPAAPEQRISAVALPVRTYGRLQVAWGDGLHFKPDNQSNVDFYEQSLQNGKLRASTGHAINKEFEIGDDDFKQRIFRVDVPPQGVNLYFRNSTLPKEKLKIQCWQVESLRDFGQAVGLVAGEANEIPGGGEVIGPIKLRQRPDMEIGTTENLDLVTTDGQNQVLRFQLRAVSAVPPAADTSPTSVSNGEAR